MKKRWLAGLTALSVLASAAALPQLMPTPYAMAEEATAATESIPLASYVNQYSTLATLSQVTFSENQVLLLVPARVHQDGCCIDVVPVRWKVGGTARTAYESGIQLDSDALNGFAYCLITATTPGSVLVQCQDELGSETFFTLQVGEDGNFDGTVSTQAPEEPIVMLGDTNDDWKFTTADVIAFQKWLLSGDNTALPVWKACDYTGDGVLNILDLRLMRQALYESTTHFGAYQYTDPSGSYNLTLATASYPGATTTIRAQWIDADGDTEGEASASIPIRNPLRTSGQWLDDNTYSNGETYWIVWTESSAILEYLDETGERQQVVFPYPDRTSVEQTVSSTLNKPSMPEITAVEITATSSGDLDQKVRVVAGSNVYDIATRGRVGAPIQVYTDASIESYTVTLHYDPSLLRWVPEENLAIRSPKDYMLDTENHTLTFSGTAHDIAYLLVDTYQYNGYGTAYTVSDITQYESNWERNGITGDIMTLADPAWARTNLVDGQFHVSTPEELASAVYYLNAVRDITALLPETPTENGLSKSQSAIDIVLEADIDLAGYDWKPIEVMEGDVIGNGHTISNMSMAYHKTPTADLGFINIATSDRIENIAFTGAEIHTSCPYTDVAILVARCGKSGLLFENVSVQGIIDAPQEGQHGTICGNTWEGECVYENCTVDVTLNGEAITAP